MKKLSLIITTLLINIWVSAQSPEKFSYQAVIRDGDGFLITESTIGMKVSILQGASPVYVETHTPTTDQNAMVYVEIGTGTSSDDFSDIDWANGIFFLKIETDILGGTNYTLVSTTQILSVPYALHAKSAETVTGTISENDPIYNGSAAAGISSGDVDNWDEAYLWGNHADAGYLQSFTEAQIISISNDTIYLTGGSFVKLPAVFSGSYYDLTNQPDFTGWDDNASDDFNGDYNNLSNQPTIPANTGDLVNNSGFITSPDDADSDPLNEIQILSISNDTVYLTAGGYIKLPAGFSGDYTDLTNQPDFTGWDDDASNDFNGDYNNLSNKPTIPTNTSDLTNNSGFITNPDDADADPSNELQVISISNDTIYLSDGGFAKLPSSFSGDWNDLINVPASIANSTFEVGDSYSGGIVVYVDETGMHGLIAKLCSTTFADVAINPNDYASGDGIGSGLTNCILHSQTSNFVRYILSYKSTVDGIKYGGWYLPSLFELQIAYDNKAVLSVPNNIFISSTKVNNQSKCYCINFSNGQVVEQINTGSGVIALVMKQF